MLPSGVPSSFPTSYSFISRLSCVPGPHKETRTAKTIFHVPGRSPRHRLAFVTCCGWPHGDRSRNFVFLSFLWLLFHEMGTRLRFDPQWFRSCDGVSDACCGFDHGALLFRNGFFLASCSFLGIARRLADMSWNDDHWDCHRHARPWRVFSRLPALRPPRNCCSTCLPLARSLILASE
jgi:hypothetical protein